MVQPDNPSGCMNVQGQPRRVLRRQPATPPQAYRISPHSLRSFRADQFLDIMGVWMPLVPLVLAVAGMWLGYFAMPALVAWLFPAAR